MIGGKSFIQVARDGDLETLNELLDSDDFDIEEEFDQGEAGEDELNVAARNGHCQIVERLIELPVVASRFDCIFGAYHNAKEERQDNIVNILSTLPSIRLYKAAEQNDLEEFEQILEDEYFGSVDLDESGVLKEPLMVAIEKGAFSIVERCLEEPAVINSITIEQDFNGLTMAARNGHIDIVRLLLEFLITTNDASDALRAAIANNDEGMLNVLLQNDDVRSCLFLTDSNDDNDCITNNYGPAHGAFLWAACHGQLELLECMLEFDDVQNDPNILDAFIEAAYTGQTRVISRLMELPIMQNAILNVNEKVICAFVFAASLDHIGVVDRLLQNTTMRDSILAADNFDTGENAFCAAADSGNLRVVNRLLEIMEDNQNAIYVNLAERAEVIAALRLAAKGQYYDVVERLLEVDRTNLEQILEDEFEEVYHHIGNKRAAKVTAVEELRQWSPCVNSNNTGKVLPSNLRSKILTFAFHDDLCGKRACTEIIQFQKANGENTCARIEELRKENENANQCNNSAKEPLQKKVKLRGG